MAIFLKAYKGYDGSLTSGLDRILVIFRYGLADALQSRLLVAYLFSCILLPVGVICFLYIYHNIEMLLAIDPQLADDLPTINGEFFALALQIPQHFLLFFLIVFVGPIMISPDLRNNAMPLYLSRPISKRNYIVGKSLVLIFLGSVTSWIPVCIVFGVQSFLAGGSWLSDYLYIPVAAFLTSMLWIICLTTVAFTISAFVKWKPVARIAFFGVFLVASIVGEIIQEIFGGVGAYMVDLGSSAQVLIATFYDARNSQVLEFVEEMSPQLALLQVSVVTAVAVTILYRRIRAYQVVS